MSTRIGVRCLAVEKLASPQQAPGSLHDEMWAGILQKQGLWISQEVEIESCSEHVGLVTIGENSRVWGMVVPWCRPREESFSFP